MTGFPGERRGETVMPEQLQLAEHFPPLRKIPVLLVFSALTVFRHGVVTRHRDVLLCCQPPNKPSLKGFGLSI